ncbi:MAG: ribose 5-phosphate isomerase B [Deltaproteobacteria bacterium]|jgi:ribose 5-phosphate isomerase B|nr:ribose 5-phosphate isomerase B [Deltaproteobacteria bacterium]
MTRKFTIAVGSDHAGPLLKAELMVFLESEGHAVLDLGCPVGTERVDYPLIAKAAVEKVASGEASFGILVCGTGIGMAMVANKTPGIRAANCHTEFSARMARAHNDCNVLALGARVLGPSLALAIAKAFLETGFEGGRHAERLALFS